MARESRLPMEAAIPETTAGEPSVSLHKISEVDALAAHVAGAFVTLVETTHGRYRRRCYLTLQAAQDAARRATDNGQNATIVLAELKPLYRVHGGEGR